MGGEAPHLPLFFGDFLRRGESRSKETFHQSLKRANVETLIIRHHIDHAALAGAMLTPEKGHCGEHSKDHGQT